MAGRPLSASRTTGSNRKPWRRNYAEDLDLYVAGTTNQVADKFTPIVMMNRVMKAFRDRTSRLDVTTGRGTIDKCGAVT